MVRAKALHVLLLLGIIYLANAASLSKLWAIDTGGWVNGLASNGQGTIGIASKCIYLVASNGTIIEKNCPSTEQYYSVRSVSYCCSRFAFLDSDQNVYIYAENGTLLESTYIDNYQYAWKILLLNDTFVAAESRIGDFYLNGTLRWDLAASQVGSLAAKDNYLYIPDYNLQEVMIVDENSGNVLKVINYNDKVLSVALCNDYLAVSTQNRVYLYSIKDTP